MTIRHALITTSVGLGLAGLVALFAPQEVCGWLGVEPTVVLQGMLQLLGALYLSLATLNWMAKDSPIGGIYSRPVSMANFTHCLIGALSLVRVQSALPLQPPGLVITALYLAGAVFFGWLAFVARGLR